MHWKALSGIGVLAACASCAIREIQPVDEARVPAKAGVESAEEIARFLRVGRAVQLSRWADLDGDGDTDAIAVAAPASTSATRTLLILRRRPDGMLERVADNPRAVPSATAGGMFGDPLRDIETHRNGFALHLEGGSRELWSRTYRFGFDRASDTWLLTNVTSNTLDRLDGTSSERSLTRNDFGAVTVLDFDPDNIVDTVQP